MPYIKPYRRSDLIQPLNLLPVNAGELNFVITNEIIRYFKRLESNYQTINDILGALEGVKLEFYRRVVIPYENVKIDENGDVY